MVVVVCGHPDVVYDSCVVAVSSKSRSERWLGLTCVLGSSDGVLLVVGGFAMWAVENGVLFDH